MPVGQHQNKLIALTLGGALLALGACAVLPGDYAPISEIQAAAPDMPKAGYRIGAGDEIEIKFFFTPELNDKLTVRPDGKISLMFAQNVQAEGLTTDELAADIRALYAPHVKQLDLVVVVRTFASQKAYVGGEVVHPGPVTLTGNETVLQALSSVGWMNMEASDHIVIVRRPNAQSPEKVYEINIGELKRGVNMAQNIVVKSGDLILVPPSDIASTDRWIDQNIRKLLPFAMNAGAAYNINPANNN